MYKTNSTNGVNSVLHAKSFVGLQHAFFREEDKAHNSDLLVINQVFEHYHHTLKMEPTLTHTLISRKINPDYINHFKIGFADRTLGFELQSPRSLQGSRSRGHLQRLGLLKASGHEFFRGAMVIPYCNNEGDIIGAYGRRLRHQRRSPAYHLYWNAQQVSFFNATDQLPESLILCKSALDALTLLTAGTDNAVATMGIQGFNEIQLSRLLEDGVRHVTIAFDNTPTADHYALLIAQALDAIGIQCYRVKLPLGQDINHFAMLQADVAGAFNRLVDEAVPLKQHYGALAPSIESHWLKQHATIEECIAFYLEEQKQAGKASRTLNTYHIHLGRFHEYCYATGIEQIEELTDEVLTSYQLYLASEQSVFTGKVISNVTQKERMDAVALMLVRLYYYSVIQEPLAFLTHRVSVH